MLFCELEKEDYVNVLASIDGFAEGLGLEALDIDEQEVASVLRGMRIDFPAQGGTERASSFKKAANFLCYFIAQRPVKKPFSSATVGDTIASIPNHQNVMVGLHIAFDALEGAVLKCDGGDVKLENRIKLSRHSYVDLIQALKLVQPVSHFHLVSVLLEQMCYRANPDASYELVI